MFFFFKQKTAYEMRISDWSSDVCSSDLLNVLVQVNIDAEAGKHGCTPGQVSALAAVIAAQPRLLLRGLMAIPAPHPDLERRREAFIRMKALFDALAAQHPQDDTLSMGMREDIELAVAEGATMVRVGTAMFGARSRESGDGIRESSKGIYGGQIGRENVGTT